MKKWILTCGAVLLSLLAVSSAEIAKSTMLYAVKGADSLRLDRYTAIGAATEKRPCMIFLFGGGFVSGTRDDGEYLDYFHYLVSRGMDVISIDYRLGLRDVTPAELASPELFAGKLAGAVRMAVDDLYSATAFVVRNADSWNIAPEKIVLCGSSAGAVTVLQGEYGCCNGSPNTAVLPEGFRYAGVISMAGAILHQGDDLVWGHKPAPLLLFHGTADSNVPYKALHVPGAGFFGSRYIAEQLYGQIHSPFVFYSVKGAAHEMATEPMFRNRFEIESFLQQLVYGKQPLMIRTEATVIGKPLPEENFTLEDFVRSNFAPAEE